MHLLITTGGTREYIDPVRFISNASSGRMGKALAKAALDAGHTVTVISAPASVRPPKGAQVVSVTSASEMFVAVKERFAACDCLIMAAAVADYTPASPSKSKLKKSANDLTIQLKPTADILRWAGHHKSRQVVVGFALEDADMLARAQAKMKAKRADFIIANSPAAIGAAASSVSIMAAGGQWLTIPRASKAAIARKIIALVCDKYR